MKWSVRPPEPACLFAAGHSSPSPPPHRSRSRQNLPVGVGGRSPRNRESQCSQLEPTPTAAERFSKACSSSLVTLLADCDLIVLCSRAILRRAAQYSPIVSPPSREPRARQRVKSTLSDTKRVESSHRTMLQPPGWKLPKAHSREFESWGTAVVSRTNAWLIG